MLAIYSDGVNLIFKLTQAAYCSLLTDYVLRVVVRNIQRYLHSDDTRVSVVLAFSINLYKHIINQLHLFTKRMIIVCPIIIKLITIHCTGKVRVADHGLLIVLLRSVEQRQLSGRNEVRICNLGCIPVEQKELVTNLRTHDTIWKCSSIGVISNNFEVINFINNFETNIELHTHKSTASKLDA